LETTDIGEKAGGAVALIECFEPTSLPKRAGPSGERTGPSGGPPGFERGLKAYEQRDYATAFNEWRVLAEQGVAEAQFNLGLLYADGQGVPLDPGQAAGWFEKAAEQDYSKAQLNLGALYSSGKGVKRDYVQAYKWFNICAAKGDSKCAARRDFVAKMLKPSQLTAAQRMSSEWKPKK
jgi:TPR repeat protein